MLGQLILFLACFVLGALCRLWYSGLSRVTRGVGKAAAIALEFISVGLIAAAFILLLFFLSDGAFMPFTLLGTAAGFLTVAIFV